ncbi:hypothetical protein QIS74_02688 [Colletotrichum tabaci]|uniref:C2H2-type domain-containing protein n=1 Tax=Colletotrichum tabaci TaxID=1209068 RepID=A0AAV9TP23_9PEZI
MASALISNPYAAQQSAHYGYVQPPQPPPSPPMDETSKCSLPSISNLLGLADQGSPTSETHPQIPQQGTDWTDCQQSGTNRISTINNARGLRLTLDTAPSHKSETRPNSSHYGGRSGLPPTPPMSSDASFDGYNSPSTRSVSQLSVVSQPQSSGNYYYESTPPLEADAHRHSMAPMVPRVPVQAPYAQQPFPHGYMSAHNPMAASYYPPMQPTPPPQAQMSGIYYQRPLPQQFPPMAPVPVGLGPAGSNPWQHHHYISPSSAASFPQSQDRYICQTCNKAFSRPSSLRIHSHSHTGEKPFKCPHTGCGKAFSVRSNMKRHERGCHNFESGGN